MIDIDDKFQKINEYLKSFVSDGNKKTNNEQNLDCINSGSSAGAAGIQIANIILSIEKKSQNEYSKKKNTLPNNIEEFHKRLRSFKNGLWTCTAISPLLCTSYGWKLINNNMLSCVTCKAVVCTTLPLPNQIEAYKTFSTKLKDRLRSGHEGWCQWPNRPSPSDFLHPPLHMTLHYANSLVKKANNLHTLGDRIPFIRCDYIIRKLDLNKTEIARFFGGNFELNSNRLIAAILVLCGWDYEDHGKIKCSICFRSIGLWNFLPLSDGSTYEELEKKNNEREERRRIIEERKRERERKNLIKEEKLKAKLLKEKKAAEAEMEAKERDLKVKKALSKLDGNLDIITPITNGDIEIPFSSSESGEEIGEEEENFLLSEDGNTELVMEEESNISEPHSVSNILVDTSSQNKAISEDVNSSHSSIGSVSPSVKNKTEESKSLETHHSMLYEDIEKNFDSDECSKHSAIDANESEDDLWLQAVGGYVEESESNLSKPGSSPSLSSNLSKPVSSPSSYSSFSSMPEISFKSLEESDNSTEFPTSNTNRKRRRSDSSEDNIMEDEENASKCRRIEVHNLQESGLPDINENAENNSETLGSLSSNENSVHVCDNENVSSSTELHVDKDEETNDEEEEEEIEEVEENTEEIVMLDKMRKSMFDPIEQHRHWCGWVVDYSSLYIDEVDTSVQGFKIIPSQISQLQPDLPDSSIATSEKYAGNIVGLRAVRSILDSWAVEQNEQEEEL